MPVARLQHLYLLTTYSPHRLLQTTRLEIRELGAALEPKQNPDGTWVFNTALTTLSVDGAAA